MAKRRTSYMLLSLASGAAVLPACGGSDSNGTISEQQSATGGASNGDASIASGGMVFGVVAMPGTGGAPATGGSTSIFPGVVAMPPPDGGGSGGACAGDACSPVQPETGGTAGGGPCGGHVCGVVVMPPADSGADAADAGAASGGTSGFPPGLVIRPDSGL
jgi:hypothetical protein